MHTDLVDLALCQSTGALEVQDRTENGTKEVGSLSISVCDRKACEEYKLHHQQVASYSQQRYSFNREDIEITHVAKIIA